MMMKWYDDDISKAVDALDSGPTNTLTPWGQSKGMKPH